MAGTVGPGAIHLLNGLYDAKLDSAPIVALTGQVETSLLGQNSHQKLDLVGLFDDVACFNEVLVHADQAADLIESAIRTAVSERGVAHLNIPSDVALAETRKGASSVDNPPVMGRMVPDPEQLARALDLLNHSTSPSILVGIGARDAAENVLDLAKSIGAPIIKTLRAKDLIPDSHPYVIGGLGLLGTEPSVDALRRTDLLVMVGTDFPYEDFYPENASVIQIDIDPRRIGLRTQVDVALVGDAKDTLLQIASGLGSHWDQQHLTTAQAEMNDWNDLQAMAEDRPAKDRGRICFQLCQGESEGTIRLNQQRWGNAGVSARSGKTCHRKSLRLLHHQVWPAAASGRPCITTSIGSGVGGVLDFPTERDESSDN